MVLENKYITSHALYEPWMNDIGSLTIKGYKRSTFCKEALRAYGTNECHRMFHNHGTCLEIVGDSEQ